jgi:GDP-4-dehydro-6-deoxy-D-mannose reductase
LNGRESKPPTGLSRILVLGATGFAGGHFCAAAEERGHQVVRAGRAGPDLKCDLLEPASLVAAVRATQPDAVVNLAGAASVGLSWEQPAAVFELNALGALHLLEAVARERPGAYLMCISSGDVYGDVAQSHLPASERTALRPVSPYASSKVALEVLCDQYARSRELAICLPRSFNHVGPGQSDRFAASSFARQIAEAEASGAASMTLRVGDLSPSRDFTDVRDTVGAYLMMLEHRLIGTYNVCSGEPVPLRQLLEWLVASTRMRVEVSLDRSRIRPKEPAVLYGTPARLNASTGWRPSISLRQSLEDLLRWWRGEVRQ